LYKKRNQNKSIKRKKGRRSGQEEKTEKKESVNDWVRTGKRVCVSIFDESLIKSTHIAHTQNDRI
jgi:hypothetical protein